MKEHNHCDIIDFIGIDVKGFNFENLGGGFFQVHRSIFEDSFFNHGEYDKRSAFLYLLSQAQYTEKKMFTSKGHVTLAPGQVITGHEKLMNQFKWKSKGRVARFLKDLKEKGSIDYESKKDKGTIITIKNYSLYQDGLKAREIKRLLETDQIKINADGRLQLNTDIKRTSNGHQAVNERTSNGHQTDPNKKDKKVKKDKKDKKETPGNSAGATPTPDNSFKAKAESFLNLFISLEHTANHSKDSKAYDGYVKAITSKTGKHSLVKYFKSGNIKPLQLAASRFNTYQGWIKKNKIRETPDGRFYFTSDFGKFLEKFDIFENEETAEVKINAAKSHGKKGNSRDVHSPGHVSEKPKVSFEELLRRGEEEN